MIRAKHGSQSPKPCDHLIDHQQNIMLLQHLLNSRPIARRRRNDPSGPKHWLSNKGGDGIGALARNHLFQTGHAMGHKLRLALPQILPAEIIRRLCMQHIGQGQIKFLMKQLQPRQRSCNQPRAVIAPPTADDLLLLRPSKNIVIIPNEFDIGLIGI